MSDINRPEFAEFRSRARSVAPGEVIFLEGSEADAVYVILKGEVQAVLTDADGKQVVINRMQPGEIFGELELLGADTKHTATIISTNGCDLLVVEKSAIEKQLAEAHPFLRYMIQHLCGIIKGWTDRARQG
jgi:CRP-like cAMP-binding protein